MFATISLLWAQQEPLISANPQAFAWTVIATVIFGLIGIALAVIGFKIFDIFTPGKLEDEILQKQNVAAAILGGAVILGICIIVASAMH